jgi:hypothetical protein
MKFKPGDYVICIGNGNRIGAGHGWEKNKKFIIKDYKYGCYWPVDDYKNTDESEYRMDGVCEEFLELVEKDKEKEFILNLINVCSK